LKAGRPGPSAPVIQPSAISDAEFARFQALVRDETGISLSDQKKALVVGRLGSRLRSRKVGSFTEYYRLISSPDEADELQMAIDLLTTNETSFFREPEHFQILKDFIRDLRPVRFPFRVWSAASSSGEEAYTIAMVLADVLGRAEWDVLGTDISTRVLAKAQRGLYPMERSAKIPPEYLRRFCLKGHGTHEGMFLIERSLRARAQFMQVNLCEPLPELGTFDVVFLRNLLIYFDAPQKRKVVEQIVRRMKPHALLLVGHSESLHGITDAVVPVRPTVYRVP
jgi:chemotaxis protein methyltransferase CheR